MKNKILDILNSNKDYCSGITDVIYQEDFDKVANELNALFSLQGVGKCEIIKEEIWQIYNKTYRNYIDRPLDDARIMLSGKHEAFGEVIDIINDNLK